MKKSSVKSNEISFGKGSSFLGKKAAFLRNNVLSLGKAPSSSRNNHVPNYFAITTMSCSFLYRLMIYHWKGLEKDYNFVVWQHFNQNSYEKNNVT